MRGAKLVAANFAGTDLRRTAFDGADCTACNFSGSKFDGATFSEARMTAANFEGFKASVDPSQLRALLAGCVACNFRGSSLAGRDLSNLALISVDFSKADLEGASFNGAALCWYSLEGAQRLTKCDPMAGADVKRADFRNVVLCEDPVGRQGCTPVGAADPRRYTGSALDGAIVP